MFPGKGNLVFDGASAVSTLMTLSTESGDETALESLSLSSVSGLNNSRDNNFGNGLTTDSTLPLLTEECLTIGKFPLVLTPKPGFCVRSSLIFRSVSCLSLSISVLSFSLFCGGCLNFGICCTEYFSASDFPSNLMSLFTLRLPSTFSVGEELSDVALLVLGFGELNCFVNGYTLKGICLILGLVGHEDCLILGEFGTDEVTRGDVGPGERVGDIGSDLGTKITDAKLSSESTLVSLCRLLSFDESEPSSFEGLRSVVFVEAGVVGSFRSSLLMIVFRESEASSSGMEGEMRSALFQF